MRVLILALALQSVFGVWKSQKKDVGTKRSGSGSMLEGVENYAVLNKKESAEMKSKKMSYIKQRKELLLNKGEQTLLLGEESVTAERDTYKVVLTAVGGVSEYTGVIKIGSPQRQPLDCIMDTGSSIAWVFSTLCDLEICQEKHQFDGEKSETYTKGKDGMSVQFGTGSLEGVISKDDIDLGGLMIPDQPFGEIERPYGNVFSLEFDGICGLSYPMASANTSLLAGLNATQAEEDKSMTFYFGENEQALIMGKPPSKFVKGASWYDVTREFYWETTLKDVTIGGESIMSGRIESDKAPAAVFDTGTSVLTMPSNYARSALAMLGSKSLTCQDIVDGKGPAVCYHFDGMDDICIKDWYEVGDEGCQANLMDLDLTKEDVFILGQPFFSEFVTTFDIANNKVGVKPVKHLL